MGIDRNGDTFGDDGCQGAVDPADDGVCANQWCEVGPKALLLAQIIQIAG